MIRAIGKKGKVIGENAPLPAVSDRFALIKAMLESLGFGLPCLGSNIAGIKDILQYEELMFHPSDNKELADKIKKLLSDRTYVDWIKRLCEERKKIFFVRLERKGFSSDE